MEKPLFSIIVPVYNVENYIRECVDSILIQNLENYELILIDDGSTDSSGIICDEYQKKNPQIKVIHKRNGGLSDARNAGIDAAGGRYLWFLDSDDFLLDKNAFMIISEMIKKRNPDVIFFSYRKYYENSHRYSESMYAHMSDTSDIRECIEQNAYKALGCNKVTKRSMIQEHDMHFPLGFTGEDLMWCAELLAYAQEIVLCKKDLMAYRQRSGSITGNSDINFRKKHIDNVFCLMNQVIKKFEIYEKTNPEQELIANYLAYEYSWLLGETFPFWREYGEDAKRLCFLLEFDLCRKVHIVKKVKKLFGLKRTAYILSLFIKKKNRKGE